MYNLEDKSYRDLAVVIMSKETITRAVERIREHVIKHNIRSVGIILHGGEPLLMKPHVFEEMMNIVKTTLSQYAQLSFVLQTNGTLITSEWVDIFVKHEILIGVSVDGLPENHDKYRVDHKGVGSYERTKRGINVLTGHEGSEKIAGGLLCVVDPFTDPIATYVNLISLGGKYIDFLLPDATYQNLPPSYGKEPVFGQWLAKIFDRWLADDNPLVHIRTFESIITSMLGHGSIVDSFGGNPLQYMVIETDGQYGGLDVLRSTAKGMSSTGMNVFDHCIDDIYSTPIIQLLQKGKDKICNTCRQCNHFEECGGGYFPHRYSKSSGFNNPSVYCKDLYFLCDHIKATLESMEVAKNHMARRANAV